jgi:hypothetical protein
VKRTRKGKNKKFEKVWRALRAKTRRGAKATPLGDDMGDFQP